MVRVPLVVDLEPERVLQVVARLLRRQPGHDRGPFGDVDDLQAAGFRQHAGHLVQLIGSRHVVGGLAAVELAARADVAQVPDTDVPIVSDCCFACSGPPAATLRNVAPLPTGRQMRSLHRQDRETGDGLLGPR